MESKHKGVLITRLGSMIIMNAHLNPNMDGDWSRDNRFYPVHNVQLEAVNKLVNMKFPDSVIILSGDFNLAKDCDLFPQFVNDGNWNDTFSSDLTPTFHSEFLKPGRTPHCIDYVLFRDPKNKLKVEQTAFMAADKIKLRNGVESYISDHLGLYAKLTGL